jgi:hypothetical protein
MPCTNRAFPDVFTPAENGFVAPEFCFVACAVMKQTARQEDAPKAQVVQLPSKIKKPIWRGVKEQACLATVPRPG